MHHVSFAWLQYGGADVYVFPEVSGIYRVVVHALYVVLETGLLCYMAALLRGMVDDGMTISAFAADVSQGNLKFAFDRTLVQTRPLIATGRISAKLLAVESVPAGSVMALMRLGDVPVGESVPPVLP